MHLLIPDGATRNLPRLRRHNTQRTCFFFVATAFLPFCCFGGMVDFWSAKKSYIIKAAADTFGPPRTQRRPLALSSQSSSVFFSPPSWWVQDHFMCHYTPCCVWFSSSASVKCRFSRVKSSLPASWSPWGDERENNQTQKQA